MQRPSPQSPEVVNCRQHRPSPTWGLHRATVVSSFPEVSSYHRLTILSPVIAGTSQPGQFVMLRTDRWAPLLLSRPFDVMRVDPAGETFDILFRVKGEGTRRLAASCPGDSLQVLGPLGRAIELASGPSPVGLIGRGAGIAPLVRIAQECARLGMQAAAFASARAPQLMPALSELRRFGVPATLSQDSGDPAALEASLDRWIRDNQVQRLYVCGSRRLARLARRLCRRHRIEGFGFADAVMACGTGLCHGCATELAQHRAGTEDPDPRSPGGASNSGQPRARYALVCVEGPVFPLDALVLGAGDASRQEG